MRFNFNESQQEIHSYPALIVSLSDFLKFMRSDSSECERVWNKYSTSKVKPLTSFAQTSSDNWRWVQVNQSAKANESQQAIHSSCADRQSIRHFNESFVSWSWRKQIGNIFHVHQRSKAECRRLLHPFWHLTSSAYLSATYFATGVTPFRSYLLAWT